MNIAGHRLPGSLLRKVHGRRRVTGGLVLAWLWYLSQPGYARAERPLADSAQRAITHGRVSRDDHAVVALYRGTALACTGTLVGPRVVLTASHCLSGGGADWAVFEFGANETSMTLGVSDVILHPGFDPVSLANDIGLAILDAAAAGVRPAQLLPPGSEPREAMDVRIVGYGSSETPGAEPARRSARAKIGHVAAGSFELETGGAQPCHGDSGGPAFIEVDGREYLAGVHSHGDNQCHERATEVRVDAHRDGFLTPWMAQMAETNTSTGERCWHDGNCATAICWRESSDGWSYCSASCGSDDACPGQMGCDGGRCVFTSMAPGQPGAGCMDRNDCTSGLCARRSKTSPLVCTERCFLDNEYPCDEGFACELDADRPSRRACFAQAREAQSGCYSAHEPCQLWTIILALWLLRRIEGGRLRGRLGRSKNIGSAESPSTGAHLDCEGISAISTQHGETSR